MSKLSILHPGPGCGSSWTLLFLGHMSFVSWVTLIIHSLEGGGHTGYRQGRLCISSKVLESETIENGKKMKPWTEIGYLLSMKAV